MLTNFQVSVRSGNQKTGPIPTTMRPMNTCPSDCPFLPTGETGGCYGTGRLFEMANKLSDSMSREVLAERLKSGATRQAQYLRDRVVGDVVAPDGGIDYGYIEDVAWAARDAGLIPFGYTHAWSRMDRDGVARIAAAGYTMNASCETEADVRRAVDLGMPATIVSDDLEEGAMIAGKRVVTCPAQTRDNVTCATCGLCAKSQRAALVRFLIHGTARRKAGRAVASRVADMSHARQDAREAVIA